MLCTLPRYEALIPSTASPRRAASWIGGFFLGDRASLVSHVGVSRPNHSSKNLGAVDANPRGLMFQDIVGTIPLLL